MATKTKKFRIESIVIDRSLLKKLGLVLEREVNTRRKGAEEKIKKLIEKAKKEIKREFKGYPKEIKELSETQIRHVKDHNQPHFKMYYSIVSSDEELEFSSIGELLSTQVFPEKIKNFSFRLSHFDSHYVDISLSFDNDYDSFAKIALSSQDEAKILKTEKDIRAILREKKTSYGWIFLFPGSKFFLLQAIGLFLSFFAAFLTVRAVKFFFGAFFSPDSLVSLLIGSMFIYFWVLNLILRDIFQYYQFKLSPESGIRKTIKFVSGSIILGIISSIIYDGFRYFFW